MTFAVWNQPMIRPCRDSCLAVLVAAAFSFFIAAGRSQAQETSNAKDFARLALEMANEYSMTVGDRKADLLIEPVLNWTNPEVGEIYGSVFIWTLDRRPVAIASMYKWYRPFTHSSHEFQSLTTENLLAQREGQRDWDVGSPGLRWEVLDGAAPPRRTALQRLVQIRNIAKAFQLEMLEKDDSVSRLRVLAQPLYRYSCESSGVIDGALIAFAKGTDPEALLLIEARGTENGKTQWHYALVRSNFLRLTAKYKETEVWTAERLESPEIYAAKGPYAKFQFDTE